MLPEPQYRRECNLSLAGGEGVPFLASHFGRAQFRRLVRRFHVAHRQRPARRLHFRHCLVARHLPHSVRLLHLHHPGAHRLPHPTQANSVGSNNTERTAGSAQHHLP